MPEGERSRENPTWWEKWYHGVGRSREEAQKTKPLKDFVVFVIPVLIVIVSVVLIVRKVNK